MKLIGLGAERMRHLAMAVLSDPRNAGARGLLGLVDSNGRWETPERAQERIKADAARSAKVADYEQRRAKLTADEIRSQQARDRLEQDGQLPGGLLGSVDEQPATGAGERRHSRLVRSQWLEARVNRPLHGSHPLRPLSGFDLEAPGIRQARRTMDKSGPGRRSRIGTNASRSRPIATGNHS